jgi:hypothetical protein
MSHSRVAHRQNETHRDQIPAHPMVLAPADSVAPQRLSVAQTLLTFSELLRERGCVAASSTSACSREKISRRMSSHCCGVNPFCSSVGLTATTTIADTYGTHHQGQLGIQQARCPEEHATGAAKGTRLGRSTYTPRDIALAQRRAGRAHGCKRPDRTKQHAPCSKVSWLSSSISPNASSTASTGEHWEPPRLEAAGGGSRNREGTGALLLSST